jgi:prepilin-type N-terminal cleavage/methylation domain-containing protein
MKRSRIMPGGFTLLEMLVVIGIISILIALLLPTLTAARRNARNAATKATIHNVKIALENYRMDCGTFPITPTGTGKIFDTGSGYTPPGYYGCSASPYEHPCVGLKAIASGSETNKLLVDVLIKTRFLDVNKNNVTAGELKDHFNTPLLVRFMVLPPADLYAEKLTETAYIWSYGADRRNDVDASATYVNLGRPDYDKIEAAKMDATPANGADDIVSWR